MVSVKYEGKEIKGCPFTHDVLAADFLMNGKHFEVIYDAKVHGYSAATFHQTCDKVDGTVTLVTLKNGAKFGGYNPDNWSGGGYKNVPTAFLYLLTDGKGSASQKFALKPGCEGNAIVCNPNYGPLFGNNGLFAFVVSTIFHLLLNLI